MAQGPLADVLRYLRRFAPSDAATETDRALLERFIEQRDQAAFETLLSRHGPMVWGVCRGLLYDRHAAEDAFQATFLILVRKAGSIGRRDLLALRCRPARGPAGACDGRPATRPRGTGDQR